MYIWECNSRGASKTNQLAMRDWTLRPVWATARVSGVSRIVLGFELEPCLGRSQYGSKASKEPEELICELIYLGGLGGAWLAMTIRQPIRFM